jgi:hypothetical protein
MLGKKNLKLGVQWITPVIPSYLDGYGEDCSLRPARVKSKSAPQSMGMIVHT